jgi:hypothetical protein
MGRAGSGADHIRPFVFVLLQLRRDVFGGIPQEPGVDPDGDQRISRLDIGLNRLGRRGKNTQRALYGLCARLAGHFLKSNKECQSGKNQKE